MKIVEGSFVRIDFSIDHDLKVRLVLYTKVWKE